MISTNLNLLQYCGFKWRTTCYVLQDNGEMFPCHRIGTLLWDKQGDEFLLKGDKIITNDKKKKEPVVVGKPLFVISKIQLRLMRIIHNSSRNYCSRSRFTPHEKISLQALEDKGLIIRNANDHYQLSELGKINLILNPVRITRRSSSN